MGRKARQFRSHLRARVRPAERAALAAWLTPRGSSPLFDAMHVADRRHGLDVVAALRRPGVTDREVLLAGLLHDCAKGRHGRRPAGRLVARRGIRRRGSGAPRRVPGLGDRRSTGCATTPSCRPPMAAAAGCSPRTVDLIRHQADPRDPEAGELLRLADEAD